MSRMGRRIVFGAVLIAALAAVLWGDWRLGQLAEANSEDLRGLSMPRDIAAPYRGLPAAAVVGVVSVLAFLELRRLASAAGASVLLVGGLAATLLLATSSYWAAELAGYVLNPRRLHPLAILPLAIALVFAEQMTRRRTQGALADLAATLLAVAYIGGCGAAVLGIRMYFGVPVLVLFLAAAKFTDIGAYFTGSFVGRHKLIPWLSPGKSWEGLAGGLAVGAAACMALVGLTGWYGGEGAFASGPRLSIWQAGLFGAVVGLAGQFGDLCESLLKRSAGVKDSGAVVPEFGGVLDIIDSVLLSAPVAAVLLALMG
jgi:phosphatidate cytidylyltransferase